MGTDAPTPRQGRLTGAIITAARATALFLAGFTLLNLLGDLFTPGFDANIWWINLHPLPAVFSRTLLLIFSILLAAWAIKPDSRPLPGFVTLAFVAIPLLFTIKNTASFYRLLLRGVIHTRVPVPLSLIIAISLSIIVLTILRRRPVPRSWIHRTWFTLVFLGCAVLFPLSQMICFGWTDYRRDADVIVVLGAKVHADGHCSDVLADRIRTACELYHEGLAPRLIFSGGPGEGDITEPEGMRRLAERLQVPPGDTILDPGGLNTAATIRNTIPIFENLHARRILVVSHFYHLPRIKMTYQRQGWDVYTVPARHTYTPRALPFYIAREVAALWVYYLRPICGADDLSG